MTAIQCEPKRTVRFYGPLAKVLNRRSFKAVGLNSASETMRCLLSNFPQLESHMRGRHYRVVMNGRAISEDELNNPVGDSHEIHIIPAICGAGGGGALTGILTGAALIAGAFLFPFAASFLTPLGIGLILQGISTLISPTPEDPLESTDPSARSYNFSGIQQTSREGVPVPVVYGEIMTGSVVLSVKVEEDDEELEIDPADYQGWRWYIYISETLVKRVQAVDQPGSGPFIVERVANAYGVLQYIPQLKYGALGYTPQGQANWVANATVTRDTSQYGLSALPFEAGSEVIVGTSIHPVGDYIFEHLFWNTDTDNNTTFTISGYFKLYQTNADYYNDTNATIWSGNTI